LRNVIPEGGREGRRVRTCLAREGGREGVFTTYMAAMGLG